MEWKELKSSNRYIVFDEYKKEKEKTQQFLVKKGKVVYAKVNHIGESNFIPGKKYILLDLVKDDFTLIGETVSLTPPRYLEVLMGLDPEFPQDKVVTEGDFIGIEYLGRDENKEGHPYTFNLFYGT